MPKRIKKPTYSWSDIKLLLEELMPLHHIVENILVIGTCLIICRPSTVQELEAAFSDILLYSSLHVLCLPSVPHGKEFHFDVGEFSMWFPGHFVKYRIQDQMNCGMLNDLSRTSVVLIDSLEPSKIIMSMWHHMHIKLLMLISPIVLLEVLSALFFLLFYLFEPFTLLVI